VADAQQEQQDDQTQWEAKQPQQDEYHASSSFKVLVAN
jgi:hypothetical protein